MTMLILLLVGVAAMIGGATLLIGATMNRRPWSDRSTGRLARAALVWTVVAGGVLLIAPIATESVSSTASLSGGSPTETTTTTSRGTLLEHEGAGVVVVLLVPVAIALAGALGDGPPARGRRVASGVLLVAACGLGAASLGIFYLPAALALLTAGVKTQPRTTAPAQIGEGS